MPVAGSGPVAQPGKGRDRPPDEEDAFIRAINRIWAWAARNTATVVASAVLLILAVGAFFWYRAYQENLEARAATELQTVQARAAAGDTAVVEALRGYLQSFGGTRPGRRARVLLSRQLLLGGQAGEAVSTVRPVVDETRPETPMGYATRKLLAEAQVASGDTAAALETLAGLADGARFGFQRRQAGAERARLLADQGRLQEAATIYERLVEEADEEEADTYRLRLGEVRARLAAGEAGDGGETGQGAEEQG